jgi:flagellum-specific peptidoglycan hydrolase FlgJ
MTGRFLKTCFGLLFALSFICEVSAKYTPKTYIETFKGQSVQLMQETGIPASIILGIAFLESGFGNSKNCVLLHNHFGIIGKNNLKERGLKYKSRYKYYESDSASFVAFCQTVQSKPYYEKLKGQTKTNVWLKKIGRTYSQSYKKWMKRVLNIIQKYHLKNYDKVVIDEGK